SFGNAAPEQAAGEVRQGFPVVELLPSGGMDAVGPDQDFAEGGTRQAATSVDELRRYRFAVLFEVHQRRARMYMFGPNPLTDRAQKKHLQLAAVDRILRPA